MVHIEKLQNWQDKFIIVENKEKGVFNLNVDRDI
jgi:hypothetical protein